MATHPDYLEAEAQHAAQHNRRSGGLLGKITRRGAAAAPQLMPGACPRRSIDDAAP
jgi:hypothetical protein